MSEIEDAKQGLRELIANGSPNGPVEKGLAAIEALEASLASFSALMDKPPRDHVLAEIGRERDRQLDVEGFDAAHDDAHSKEELALAASIYANPDPYGDGYYVKDIPVTGSNDVPVRWPWAPEWWKPTSRRRDLIKAAALIVAEIERLDRNG